MRRRSRLDYAFAVGRVRSLERYLLPRRLFLDALESPDLASGLKLVYDAGLWPEEIVRLRTPEDVDNLSRQELAKLDKLMAELLEADILTLFRQDGYGEGVLGLAQKTGYSFFINYARHSTDLANIKLFLRFVYRGRSKNELSDKLRAGGFIDCRVFVHSLGRPWSDLYPLLAKTDYRHLWEKSLRAIAEENTFIVLEREIENFLTALWRQSKQVVFGPEPVFVYGMARKREIQLMRLISIGRMLRLPLDYLSRRVSDTYV